MGPTAAPQDPALLLRIPTLDTILGVHAASLGADFAGYRNHTYRVANLCVAQLSGSAEEIERVAVAAAFHDLGIWTDQTFDYLIPSAALAGAYLTRSGRAEWIPEITETICCHHKVTTHRGRNRWLVEAFRRADWMDVSMGIVTCGLPRRLFAATLAACGREPDSTTALPIWPCGACGHIPGVRSRWSGCEHVHEDTRKGDAMTLLADTSATHLVNAPVESIWRIEGFRSGLSR